MSDEMAKFYRSQDGYGWRLWLTQRLRVGSRRSMTPMWPHIRKSYDEFCNEVLAVHLYPLVSIDWWYRRKQRTEADGVCLACRNELAAFNLGRSDTDTYVHQEKRQ